ncbi:MAG: hypothetical protein ACI31M_00050 [Bacilli bacterium]
MVKYYKELEHRLNYYLPLVDIEDKGKKVLFDYVIPYSFIEKYANLFKNSESLINIYKNFNIHEWFEKNIYIDYEKACSVSSEFESIDEEMYWILDEYKKIDFSSKAIENYLYLIKRLSFIYIDLFPNNKEYYTSLNKKNIEAIDELKKYMTIQYVPNKKDDVYQPDAWYITPNGYLYNVGKCGHKGRDLSFNYNRIKYSINDNENILKTHNTSNGYLNMSKKIKEKGYITAGQFKLFLNYISQPAYLEYINGIPVTRERHIIELILGIINAKACFYRFFEDLYIYTESPQNEIEKIINWTNDDIGDVLVRCCGFHKIESMQEKTITTSCVNYEKELEEYIKNGWNVVFIPPFIIDKDNHCIKQYPEDFLVIKKLLKK